MAYTITVSGGRAPYSLTSSETALLPVPSVLNGHTFQVVPNNPSVVDAGLPPGSLPVRTVVITARDSLGTEAISTNKVGLNFLTGYKIFFGASTCPAGVPCRGGETTIFFDSTTNGNLISQKRFHIERIRGPFKFVYPLNSNTLVDVLDIDSDHEGKFVTVIRADPGVVSEVSIIRVTDVASGVTTDFVFVISSLTASGTLTLLPPTLSFAGSIPQNCGSGSADVLVMDGRPPYTALSSNVNVTVTPVSPNTNPGRFKVSVAAAPPPCMTGPQVLFQDSGGGRASLTITTTPGPTPPAPPPMAVAPTTMTLTCGASGSATVVGGSGSYSASSSHPRVTALVSGSTVTITRLGTSVGVPGSEVGAPYPTTASVTITDGATIQTVLVTVPASCP
jgi:hypothetical protein